MNDLCPMCMASINAYPCQVCGFSPMAISTTPLNTLKAGTLINGRYRIDKYLAAGGMGAVYQAFDSATNRICILKELLDQGEAEDQAERIKQFIQEAQILANLHHPHIAAVWDAFEFQGKHYLAEEFLAGGSLEKNTQMLSEAKLVHWALQIADALAYLHKQNIIYRDLKPDNVLLRDTGEIVLADFGIARHFKQDRSRDTAIFATPGYAPLEQMGQAMQSGSHSDVYAFGATLHHLATGKAPSHWMKPLAYWAEFPDLQKIRLDLSPDFCQIINQCLRLQISQRFPNASPLKEKLQQLYLRWQAALCTCGYQNTLDAQSCKNCQRSLVRPRGWQAKLLGPFRLKKGTNPFSLSWQTKLQEEVRGQVTLEAGLLYAATQNGNLFTLNLEGTVLKKENLGSKARATPYFHDGKIWVGTQNGLWSNGTYVTGGVEIFVPPVFDSKGLWVLNHQGVLSRLDSNNKELWNFHLGGTGIVPLTQVANGIIVLNKEGQMAAVDDHGKVIWQTDIGASIYGSVHYTSKELRLLDSHGFLQIWDAQTGQKVIQQSAVGINHSSLSAGFPSIASDDRGFTVAMDHQSNQSWTYNTSAYVFAAPILAGNLVIIADINGGIHFLEQQTGRNAQKTINTTESWVAPLIADENSIFGVSRAGVVMCFTSG
jgi:eukaryotic-like serine/threonine-protein kinase